MRKDVLGNPEMIIIKDAPQIGLWVRPFLDKGGDLEMLNISFPNDLGSSLMMKLIQDKFGPPDKSSVQTLQNGYGATTTRPFAQWLRPDYVVTYQGYGIDPGNFSRSALWGTILIETRRRFETTSEQPKVRAF